VIYVVLGMHKSGTTLVSQILHHSGINMADGLDPAVDYDGGNKYERQEALRINMALLGTDEVEILELSPPTNAPPAELRERMTAMIASCAHRFDQWGFKDPRTTITYDSWRSVLPPHRIIGIYRSPSAIWPRYRYRGPHYMLLNARRARSLLARWYEHNLRLLEIVDSSGGDALLLSYHALMTTDDEFRRLGRFIGRVLADRRQPGLYRHRGGFSPLLSLARFRLRHDFPLGIRELESALDAMRRRQLAAESGSREEQS